MPEKERCQSPRYAETGALLAELLLGGSGAYFSHLFALGGLLTRHGVAWHTLGAPKALQEHSWERPGGQNTLVPPKSVLAQFPLVLQTKGVSDLRQHWDGKRGFQTSGSKRVVVVPGVVGFRWFCLAVCASSERLEATAGSESFARVVGMARVKESMCVHVSVCV